MKKSKRKRKLRAALADIRKLRNALADLESSLRRLRGTVEDIKTQSTCTHNMKTRIDGHDSVLRRHNQEIKQLEAMKELIPENTNPLGLPPMDRDESIKS